MAAHLRNCLPTHGGAKANNRPDALLLLRVQANGAPAFWLDLATKPEAKLKDVDRFLSGPLHLGNGADVVSDTAPARPAR
jgi:hypothetical protein